MDTDFAPTVTGKNCINCLVKQDVVPIRIFVHVEIHLVRLSCVQ